MCSFYNQHAFSSHSVTKAFGSLLGLVWFSFLSTEPCWEAFGRRGLQGEILSLSPGRGPSAGPKLIPAQGFPWGLSQARDPHQRVSGPCGAVSLSHLPPCVTPPPGVTPPPDSRSEQALRAPAGTGQDRAVSQQLWRAQGVLWGWAGRAPGAVRPHTCDSHSIFKCSSSFPSMATLGAQLLPGMSCAQL